MMDDFRAYVQQGALCVQEDDLGGNSTVVIDLTPEKARVILRALVVYLSVLENQGELLND